VKLLRTIRLDPSDTFVFRRAAEPGDWAVPGAFMFGADPRTLEGQPRAAFRSGFLGVPSFGWSTLVQIVEATEADRANLIELLATYFHERLGAPGAAEARAAAQQEVAFAASLCEHPLDTLVAVHRTVEAEGIRESFRTLRPRGERQPMRAFSFLDVDGEEEPGQAPDESIDLVKLGDGERR
jgi:hypothetical protein